MNNIRLDDLDALLPERLNADERAQVKTRVLQEIALELHRYYGGKMMTVPKAGMDGPAWFNVWYTPGVSRVSTAIRDDNDLSFDLTNRGNLVGIVSDSTRVLGDGDCTPPGGLGVMEGKAFLMKYLGGCDAVALCMDSRDTAGMHDPRRIVDFVRMVEPSFGAINLEDISQPNCHVVLDALRETCSIPVWHDDAQGTACVILAAARNALELAGKTLDGAKTVFVGAGASNATAARLMIKAGASAASMVLFDVHGALSTRRTEFRDDPAYHWQWELCQATNPEHETDPEHACRGADLLIAASTPGPGVVSPAWIKAMADRPIVFACANPVPEIWPHEARAAGAFIVATGRGDFPNQVNNALGFPGILKGALLVRARRITDEMAIAAAMSLARSAAQRGLDPEAIIPAMHENRIFPAEARAVAEQAMRDKVARVTLEGSEVERRAEQDIQEARAAYQHLLDGSFIKPPPAELIRKAIRRVCPDAPLT